jgi:membrane protease YdiL (CAAX protease family)
MSSYRIAVLVVYGLSAFSLSAQVHARWLAQRSVSFPIVYCLILFTILLWGVPVAKLEPFDHISIRDVVVGLPIGFFAGLGLWSLDALILRVIAQRKSNRSDRRVRSPRGPSRHSEFEASFTQYSVTDLISEGTRRRPGYLRIQENRDLVLSGWRWGLVSSAIVAVLEEAVHRGLLLGVAKSLETRWIFIVSCVFLTLAFSFSHAWFGLAQVAAKTPLSIFAMAVTLFFGSVLPAMAAHVVFNLVTVIQGSHRQESDQIVLNRWVQRIIHARHATTAGK